MKRLLAMLSVYCETGRKDTILDEMQPILDCIVRPSSESAVVSVATLSIPESPRIFIELDSGLAKARVYGRAKSQNGKLHAVSERVVAKNFFALDGAIPMPKVEQIHIKCVI